MVKKVMYALVALLGFSVACSTVKKAPQKSAEPTESADTVTVQPGDPNRRVMLMYGVRPPVPDSARVNQFKVDDSLSPVAEKPEDEPSTPAAK